MLAGVAAVFGAYAGLRAMMTTDASGAAVASVEATEIPTLDKPVAGPRGAGRDGMRVSVVRSIAEVRPTYVTLSGRTESARTVIVKAETSGAVTSAPVAEGALVSRGDVLCGVDADGRDAKLREAQADLAEAELAHRSAAQLEEKGWTSPARVASMKAKLDAARAALQVAQSEVDKTRVRAPFDGVFERRAAEVGEFLSPGAPCGTVVELDPILVVGEVPDRLAALMKPGAAARLHLQDGGEKPGRVRYVARTPGAASGEFRIEVELENGDGAVSVGRSADVRIEVGEGDAHRIDPALLTTDASGHIGVRYIDVGGVVAFAPADVVDGSAESVWVSGLPSEVLLVERGQGDVALGVRATPVIAGEAS